MTKNKAGHLFSIIGSVTDCSKFCPLFSGLFLFVTHVSVTCHAYACWFFGDVMGLFIGFGRYCG